MQWPVINPLSRYRNAVRLKASENPPAWVGDIPSRHDLYWKTEAAMEEGNPLLLLERGEKGRAAAHAVDFRAGPTPPTTTAIRSGRSTATNRSASRTTTAPPAAHLNCSTSTTPPAARRPRTTPPRPSSGATWPDKPLHGGPVADRPLLGRRGPPAADRRVTVR